MAIIFYIYMYNFMKSVVSLLYKDKQGMKL